jgi:uridine kinase
LVAAAPRSVIEPLVRGEPARFQRFDWSTRTLAEWISIDPSPIVIIEGVSSGRSEWSEHLAFLVWIETPERVRLDRVVRRDGVEALEDWHAGSAVEEAHYARDPTRGRADMKIDGSA